MLNKEQHLVMMTQLLKDIYEDTLLAPLLGFKGGTAAMLFYDLPRFSVDLDFDLLDNTQGRPQEIMDRLTALAGKRAKIIDNYIKRHTVFLLLSYGDKDRNVKIEISTRFQDFLSKECYELKEHLGIVMQVGKPDYLFSTKLTALTTRNKFASRDLFDVEYYARNRWGIKEEIIQFYTGKTLKQYLPDCIKKVEQAPQDRLLEGLGELLYDEKQKAWVKNHLKDETLFILKAYLSVLK